MRDFSCLNLDFQAQWEALVPQPGVRLIKERGVFGYSDSEKKPSHEWHE
jgi:hypothetical protein